MNNTSRFGFGANWKGFIAKLDDERVQAATASITRITGHQLLTGKTFLDIGSGSGLFSLAARKLGARVHSFDFDQDSVECTQILKDRFFPGDTDWKIEHASVLDEAYLAKLGEFDIVYSWGVLHHTGSMWQAITNAAHLVKHEGVFIISIYNDEGGSSKRWRMVKAAYNRLPAFLRPALVVSVAGLFESKYALIRLLKGRNPLPFKEWQQAKEERGMSPWTNWVDWIGGYPFEVARPDEIFRFLRDAGFSLQDMNISMGYGCNEYVFRRG